MEVRQVTRWRQWPSGDSKPIAVLALEPEELTARHRLKFHEGIDDLGRNRLAAIELVKGVQAWISKHDEDRNPVTVVYVDAGLDVAMALTQLIMMFGISRDDLLWAAPQASRDRVSA